MTRNLGDYRLEELLGYGGAGEVWRARHRSSDDEVALKWLRGAGPANRERQLREAGLLTAVSHPNLVRLREVVGDHGDPVLVLDYLAGGSLASLLARRGRLAAGEVVSIIAPLAAALAYAHDEGLVHADVTPANILFTDRGRPVFTDLGIARVLGEVGDVQATPEYVDPVVAGGAAPGPASDVFGLAAVAFHALTGVPPWNAATAADALAVAASGEVPDLRRLAPDAPEDLIDVLSRALSAQPHLRGTAAEFALDVRHACLPEPVRFAAEDAAARVRASVTGALTHAVRVPHPEGPAHAVPPRPPGRLRRAAHSGLRRRRDILAGAAVLLAIAAAALLGLQWGSATGPPSAAEPTVTAPAATVTAAAATAPAVPSTLTVAPDGVDEFAVPRAAAGWLALLDSLYDRRAGAFTAGDVERLAGVYTEDSTQAAIDRAEIERLAAAGHRLDDFDPDVLSVESARGSAPEVTLTITDSFGPYAVVDDQRVVSAQAGRGATPVEVSLRLTPSGWRIESAVRLTGSG